MPPGSVATVDKILQYTTVAANALQDVAAATQIPFLNSVCTLSLSAIPIVQDTKSHKERCLRMLEEIHHSLCVLMSLCIHSEEVRSPKMLDHIAQYALYGHARLSLPTFSHVIAQLAARHPTLASLHLIEPGISGDADAHGSNTAHAHQSNAPCAHCGHPACCALERAEKDSDLVAFGRLFVSNPDLPTPLKKNLPLATADPSSFYRVGEDSPNGYTDQTGATAAAA
ncbi:hypothetical protein B0H14DRAFT_3509727 [Mycena olivaceomarginata]|nr:hypothetical protein B0H14DRAFT_3509727 [Mycena olivaceomarginata]